MPIRYEYHPEDNTVRTFPTGIPSVEGSRAYFGVIVADPAVGNGFLEVVRGEEELRAMPTTMRTREGDS